MAAEGQRAQSSAREQGSHADRAPRVVGPQTNMEAAAIAAAARADQGEPKVPAIDWPVPVVNDPATAAFEIASEVSQIATLLDAMARSLTEHAEGHDGLLANLARDASDVARLSARHLRRSGDALLGVEVALNRAGANR